MDHKKIQNFTDLVAWQKGHEVVLEIYRMTKQFPKDELFGLVSQMRRASVSVTSNIAEGFGRKTLLDKGHFYTMAIGSAYELQNQCFICRDLQYACKEDVDFLQSRLVEISKMLNGLISSLRRVQS